MQSQSINYLLLLVKRISLFYKAKTFIFILTKLLFRDTMIEIVNNAYQKCCIAHNVLLIDETYNVPLT